MYRPCRYNPYNIQPEDIMRLGMHWKPSKQEEWIDQDWARIRRTYIFEQVAGLILLPRRADGNDELREGCKGLRTDHMNWWTDCNSFFLTTEPSSDEPPAISLPYIRIPMNLAPYCGRWSSDPDAYPWTTSWLISTADNEEKLDEIEERLRSADRTAIRWNFVGLGIKG